MRKNQKRQTIGILTKEMREEYKLQRKSWLEYEGQKVSYNNYIDRLRNGMTIEQALEIPKWTHFKINNL